MNFEESLKAFHCTNRGKHYSIFILMYKFHKAQEKEKLKATQKGFKLTESFPGLFFNLNLPEFPFAFLHTRFSLRLSCLLLFCS